MNNIISSIIEEDTRLRHSKVDDQGGVDALGALSIKDKEKLICGHCGREEHKIEKCFKKHGFPPPWKKGKTQPEGVRGTNWNKQTTLHLKGSFQW